MLAYGKLFSKTTISLLGYFYPPHNLFIVLHICYEM